MQCTAALQVPFAGMAVQSPMTSPRRAQASDAATAAAAACNATAAAAASAVTAAASGDPVATAEKLGSALSEVAGQLGRTLKQLRSSLPPGVKLIRRLDRCGACVGDACKRFTHTTTPCPLTALPQHSPNLSLTPHPHPPPQPASGPGCAAGPGRRLPCHLQEAGGGAAGPGAAGRRRAGQGAQPRWEREGVGGIHWRVMAMTTN